MTFRAWLAIGAASSLIACTISPPADVEPASPFIQELPEEILAIAAPYQDLTAVMINPSDNCYVYRHVGVVETTLLPLRTLDGRPICIARSELEPSS
ncbi:hypothetical protein [Nereida ignava]|uniref:hypothetical protein n=1 Tax=Nereida ignava TaxID=282199 RepID=UPI003F6BE537